MERLLKLFQHIELSSRNGEGIRNTPSSFNPLFYAPMADSCFHSPLRDGLCFFVKFYYMAISFIVSLFSSCSPDAILRGVYPIIVHSFKRMFNRRFITHIMVKIDKRFHPFIAYGNPSSSIVFIRFIFTIITSASHSNPSIIYRCSAKRMCGAIININLRPETPTTFSVSGSQGVSRNFLGGSTSASTYPGDLFCFFRFICASIKNSQFVESFSSYIYNFAHNSVSYIYKCCMAIIFQMTKHVKYILSGEENVLGGEDA